jgi:hypothetical protein
MAKSEGSISTVGQQEDHLVLRSPVKDVVIKNSSEPKVEMRLRQISLLRPG